MAQIKAFPSTLLYGADYNPEQWPEAVWLEDMRLMKLANVNLVSINIFSWAFLEPSLDNYQFEQLDRIMNLLAEHKIGANLATATASPPTWMSRRYSDLLAVTYEGQRLSHGSRQHYCPNSRNYRREAAELVQQLASRYRKHPALSMWHVNNEYGCEIAACYCDNCAHAFRVWLQKRYQSLAGLNVTWGTDFWSQRYSDWEDVFPPRITSAQHNPTQRLDYWRFMSHSWLECYQNEATILRELTPKVPITTNFMVAFKPIDYFAWAPYLDIVSFDNYPPNTMSPSEVALTHDLMRSLKGGRPYFVMEQAPSQTNWRPQNPQKRPGRLRLQSLQAIAHGADGVMYFQWRQSQTGAEKFHSAVVPHEGSEDGRIFQDVKQIGAELHQLASVVTGTRVRAQVALLMDWQNWWAVEYLPGPSDRLNYWEQLKAYYRAFHEQNIAVDIVASDGDLSAYRVVVAPLLHMVRPTVAEKLERFVERGGTFLTSFFSGIVDQDDHVILGGYPGPLRKLLGVYVEEFDPWTDDMHNELIVEGGPLQGRYPCALWGELVHLEGAQALGSFAQDYYAGGPALTVHTYASGRAYYLATQPSPDLLARLTSQICQEAGVAAVLAAPAGVEVTRRLQADGRALYFVLNHNDDAVSVTLPAGRFDSLLTTAELTGQIELAARDVEVLREHKG